MYEALAGYLARRLGMVMCGLTRAGVPLFSCVELPRLDKRTRSCVGSNSISEFCIWRATVGRNISRVSQILFTPTSGVGVSLGFLRTAIAALSNGNASSSRGTVCESSLNRCRCLNPVL